jgi:glycosyltransferase involved in cell wall biosynthesis
MTRRIIALLGRKDEPTDAVEEYCSYLGVALEKHDFVLQIFRVAWDKDGWNEALEALKLQSADWSDTWVLVQYTALAWSARGFPRKVLGVLKILKEGNARVVIVYHDVEAYPGSRVLDKIRRVSQLRAMRDALSLADAGVFTIALHNVSWLSKMESKAHFIPVGPNLPIPENVTASPASVGLPSITVFSITAGQAGEQETRTILAAVRHAAEKIGKLRLSVFGRHAELREKHLRDGLRDLPVEISVDGVIEPEQVVEKLRASDVLLFVRGTISSRRGSAIAGIACGLPVIAYPGSETASPITDAGVVLVPYDHPDELNAALLRVLSDTAYRTDLANRSRAVYQAHLSWPVIAARLCALLDNG